MTPFPGTIAFGALAVLAFDTLGSLASKTFGFPYSFLSIGSFIIYAATGFLAARTSGVPAGAAAGAIVAFIEATIGWTISWAIGPGRLPTGYPGIPALIRTVIVVTLTGAFIGLVGALIGRVFRPTVAA